MENSFFEIMSKYSDEQLIRIVTEQRNDYREDAVTVAEDILVRRGIVIEQPCRQPMTSEEIRNEMNERLSDGESFFSVKSDFKERGIDVPDITEKLEIQEEKSLNSGSKKRKRNHIIGWIFIAIGIFRLIMGFSYYGNQRDIIVGVVLIVGTFLGFAFDYFKNSYVGDD